MTCPPLVLYYAVTDFARKKSPCEQGQMRGCLIVFILYHKRKDTSSHNPQGLHYLFRIQKKYFFEKTLELFILQMFTICGHVKFLLLFSRIFIFLLQLFGILIKFF